MFSGPVLVISILMAFSVQGTTVSSSASITSTPVFTSSSTVSVNNTEGTTVSSSASITSTPAGNTLSSTVFVNSAEGATRSSPSATPSATTGGSSAPVTPTEPSLSKMCGSITIKLKKLNSSNVTKEDYIKAIKSFFNDPKKYTNVNVSDLEIGNSEGETFELSFKLCLVHLSTDGFIEDVLLQKVKDGKLLNISIAVGENSFTFEVSGVKFSDWKAKEGECKKCSEGGGGPIVIEGKCEPEHGHSCKGLKKTKKVKDCVKYCNAVSRIMVSTVVMAIGIALSLSYNIWG